MKKGFIRKIFPVVLIALVFMVTCIVSNVQQTFAEDEIVTDDGAAAGEAGMSGATSDGAPELAALYFSAGLESTENEYDLVENPDLYSLAYDSIATDDSTGWWILSGLNLTSDDYTFNGIIATGEDTVVVLKDSTIALTVGEDLEDADADGGSAVGVDDGATLYITNSILTVDGAGRYVTSAYNDGTIIVNDSTIESLGNTGTTDIISDPASNAGLLISGTARANFSIGATQTYYFNSNVIAEGWAALSTDSATGDGLDLYAYNTYAEATNGGYGTYADTNCRVWLYGSELQSAEIGAIISKTGEIYVTDGASASDDLLSYMSEDGETTEDGTTITGGRNAVMVHAPDMMGEGVSAASTGVLTVINSTLATDESLVSTCDYAETYGDATGAYIDYISGAAILVKSTSATITLDNATIDSYTDTILMTVINSDSMGNFLSEGDGDSVDPISLTMTDMDVDGDILHMDYQRNMEVTLSNTTWSGKIISGTMEDWNAIWADYADEDLNWLVDTEWDTVYGASLTLTDDSTWIVTEESTLTSLYVEEGSTIYGTMTVDGVETEIETGITYTGTIVIESILLEAGDTASYPDGFDGTDTIMVADGCLLTMTVDGVETEYVAGTTYSGDVEFKSTSILGVISGYTTGDTSDYYYRAALYITSEGLITDMSVLSAVQSATEDYYTVAEDGTITISGIYVSSTTSGFTSLMINNEDTTAATTGDTTNDGTDTLYVVVNDSTFDALSDSDGSDVNDFCGYGAVISAFGDVNLTIDNVTVNSTGVAKVAFFAADGADLLVTDSEFTVLGGTLYDGYANTADQSAMVAPPWVLGISGNARGTNLLGSNSTNTFVDSDFTTYAWGVLSVDAGSDGIINVLNCTLTQTSDTGYGIYGIGNSIETFYGCTFDVGTYAAIITGGTITFTASTDNQTIETYNSTGDLVTTATSDEDGSITKVESQFGVMNHGNADITVEAGTVFDTENAVFLCKNGDATITVDDSILDVEDGVIIQVIDNDDSTVGVQSDAVLNPTFNTTFYEEEGYPTESYDSTTASTTETATFTNVNLTDKEYYMYNASGYLATAKALDVTLGENAEYNGVITSSTCIHVWMEYNEATESYDYMYDENGDYIQATEFTIDEYYNLGHVVNEAYFNGYNTTAVTLTDNAVWKVTDTCYLSSLTVGEDATITASQKGYTVVMSVDGVYTEIVPGTTYEGEIELTLVKGNSNDNRFFKDYNNTGYDMYKHMTNWINKATLKAEKFEKTYEAAKYTKAYSNTGYAANINSSKFTKASSNTGYDFSKHISIWLKK